jgi:hypothetical protein
MSKILENDKFMDSILIFMKDKGLEIEDVLSVEIDEKSNEMFVNIPEDYNYLFEKTYPEYDLHDTVNDFFKNIVKKMEN